MPRRYGRGRGRKSSPYGPAVPLPARAVAQCAVSADFPSAPGPPPPGSPSAVPPTRRRPAGSPAGRRPAPPGRERSWSRRRSRAAPRAARECRGGRSPRRAACPGGRRRPPGSGEYATGAGAWSARRQLRSSGPAWPRLPSSKSALGTSEQGRSRLCRHWSTSRPGRPAAAARARGALHAPDGVIAGTRHPDRALGGELAERLDRLLERDRTVLCADVQQVEPVGAEPFPAAVGVLADRFRRQALRVVDESCAGCEWGGAQLGGDEDLVADPAAAPPLPPAVVRSGRRGHRPPRTRSCRTCR